MNLEAIYNREVSLKPTTLEILIWPNERLRTECEDIEIFDTDENKHLEQLTMDMGYTIYDLQAIGLAAPQVGIPANMFVLLFKDDILPFINPKIISTSNNMMVWEEGCLSVPGYFEKRSRPNVIVAEYQTLTGKKKESEFHGLIAFAFQHELDHLNGKLFIDGASWFKQGRIKTRMKKYLKKFGTQ